MDDLRRHCSIIDFAKVATGQWFDFHIQAQG